MLNSKLSEFKADIFLERADVKKMCVFYRARYGSSREKPKIGPFYELGSPQAQLIM